MTELKFKKGDRVKTTNIVRANKGGQRLKPLDNQSGTIKDNSPYGMHYTLIFDSSLAEAFNREGWFIEEKYLMKEEYEVDSDGNLR